MNPSDSYNDDFDDKAFGSADDITWEPQPICWPRLDREAAEERRTRKQAS